MSKLLNPIGYKGDVWSGPARKSGAYYLRLYPRGY